MADKQENTSGQKLEKSKSYEEMELLMKRDHAWYARIRNTFFGVYNPDKVEIVPSQSQPANPSPSSSTEITSQPESASDTDLLSRPGTSSQPDTEEESPRPLSSILKSGNAVIKIDPIRESVRFVDEDAAPEETEALDISSPDHGYNYRRNDQPNVREQEELKDWPISVYIVFALVVIVLLAIFLYVAAEVQKHNES